jgi:hypothetical protein
MLKWLPWIQRLWQSEMLKWLPSSEIRLVFDSTSMFTFVSQICEALDLQKYGDTSTIQNDLHGFRGFGK